MANFVPKSDCRRRASAAILAFMAIATSAAAQSRTDFDQALQRTPQAGVAVEHALTGEWERIEFFAVRDNTVRTPDNRPWIEFAARRQNGSAGTAGVTTWTTSRDCPALRNTLIWLTTLVAPRIEISGITPNEGAHEGRRPLNVVADGLQTTVWGRGTQPDHVANTRVEMSSNGGLIAQFGAAATHNLAGCWRSRKPAD